MTTSPACARLLTIDEAVALKEATDPRVSPDGRLVAFCVGEVSKAKEHAEGTIYLAAADGATPPRPFTQGPGLDAAPRWSPDGEQLAFVSDRAKRGRPSLYVIPAAGGEARRLVTQRGEVAHPAWSPDGTRIAFLLKEIDSKEEKKRKKQRDDAIVIDDDKYTRLWMVDVASGAAARLSPDGVNVWSHAWAPSGDRIAFLHTPTPRLNDSYSLNSISTLAVPASGAVPGEPTTLCRVYGDVSGALCWSPDGMRLALIGAERQRPFAPSADAPLLVSADGGEPRSVLEGHPAQFTWAGWLSDGELAVTGVEGLHGVYYRLALDGGTLAPLFAGEQPHGSPREFALSADRATLAFTLEQTTSPGDVWAVCAGGAPRRLTTLNPLLDEVAWGAVESVAWTAPDGVEIQGLLIKPVGYQQGTRYPTVVHVHGGPAWLWSERFYAGWHDWGQLLAARGYAVLLPNPRGSTGRGSAFVAMNYDDVGGGEWQDVLAGAQWAIDSGIADPARLGIGGWSWGGYLSAWAVTQTDLFKAAVVGAGVTNLWSDHGQNDIPDMNRLLFHELPYTDPASYCEPSPMRHVANVKTPTLILHGAADERVTPAQARELYRALKTLGVPTQLVLYPREPHSFAERLHQLDLLRRVLAWFDMYLKV